MSVEGITSNKVKINCLLRWGKEDNKIRNFDSFYEKWLNQMSAELKMIALLLLNEFDYYSEENVKCGMEKIHSSLLENDIIDPLLTAYCPITKESGMAHSSIAYWIQYWLVNSISKERCREDIKDFSDQWEYVESIVFIDDCAGTGGTFVDFLESNIELLKDKKIVYVIIHIMENAYNRIIKVAEEKDLKISIVYYRRTPKAFELSDSLSKLKTTFWEESEKVGIKKKLIMGFEDSQSLIAFYNNTPNNTVGIFGESGRNFKPLFPRRTNHKVDYRMAAQKKKDRNEESYHSMKGK